MLNAVRDLIVEFSISAVEWIVWLENVILQPQRPIGDEEFSVQVISDSASILNFSHHVLNSFPGVRNALSSTHR